MLSNCQCPRHFIIRPYDTWEVVLWEGLGPDTYLSILQRESTQKGNTFAEDHRARMQILTSLTLEPLLLASLKQPSEWPLEITQGLV